MVGINKVPAETVGIYKILAVGVNRVPAETV